MLLSTDYPTSIPPSISLTQNCELFLTGCIAALVDSSNEYKQQRRISRATLSSIPRSRSSWEKYVLTVKASGAAGIYSPRNFPNAVNHNLLVFALREVWSNQLKINRVGCAVAKVDGHTSFSSAENSSLYRSPVVSFRSFSAPLGGASEVFVYVASSTQAKPKAQWVFTVTDRSVQMHLDRLPVNTQVIARTGPWPRAVTAQAVKHA